MGAEDYEVGAVKRHLVDGKCVAVAIRTGPPTVQPWAVMTISQGGHHADHNEVADWDDAE